ncbi:alpha/beta hydrolase [Treponema phagedenis]|uniref:Alpha/beta hydrolase n=1 Tax=Treponema phagedenis TaxID=162 RepID=A0A0B7GUA3_TREPH|nr:alpha/beta hydrolase [Treponema phagedenis]NVP24204.1 alpha/beta hydrolase [Treponema phagedenis]QEJ94176.1 alpha/beta hydrolase [Treponema phagedenis]QEJ99237.1 alpha/beta hydrolase [Treponema phagedenis]QEK00135.1 alpha/beta hydrolase [Treponema phagedenis]QEK04804.1 alpha/beta hydrolase [Treponema phagedenis]
MRKYKVIYYINMVVLIFFLNSFLVADGQYALSSYNDYLPFSKKRVYKELVKDNTVDKTLTDNNLLWYPMAIYCPQQQGEYPLILLTHGWNDTQKTHQALARFLASYGFVTVVFTSANQRHPENWIAAFDTVLKILHKEAENPDRKFYKKINFSNMGIIGHSMGGTAALHYGNLHPEFIKTVIALHPFNGASKIIDTISGGNKFLGDSLPNMQSAVLIITGTKDVVAYPEKTYLFYKNLPKDIPACFLSFKDYKHNHPIEKKSLNVFTADLSGRYEPEKYQQYRRVICYWELLFLKQQEENRMYFTEFGKGFKEIKPLLEGKTGDASYVPAFEEQNISK